MSEPMSDEPGDATPRRSPIESADYAPDLSTIWGRLLSRGESVDTLVVRPVLDRTHQPRLKGAP